MIPGSHHYVRMALDAALVAMARDGRMPSITAVHSIFEDGDEVHVNFDIAGESEVLAFEFTRPSLVARHETREFVEWLAWGDAGTVH